LMSFDCFHNISTMYFIQLWNNTEQYIIILIRLKSKPVKYS
jgi:hypothetical protein